MLNPDDPRYQGENFELNMRLVQKLGELAAAKASSTGLPVTPASFCLAWVLFQDTRMFVIPGTKSAKRFRENFGAAKVLEAFTKEDDKAVRDLVQQIQVVGSRYPESFLKYLDA